MKRRIGLAIVAAGTLGVPSSAVGTVTPIQGPYYEECAVTTGVALQGNNEADSVIGTDFIDLLRAGGGPDVVAGRAANDCIFGDAGTDIVKGDEGDDLVVGGSQGDKLFGGSGNDILKGGPANDQLLGGPGVNTFNCGGGIDVVFKAKRADKVSKNCERVNEG